MPTFKYFPFVLITFLISAYHVSNSTNLRFDATRQGSQTGVETPETLTLFQRRLQEDMLESDQSSSIFIPNGYDNDPNDEIPTEVEEIVEDYTLSLGEPTENQNHPDVTVTNQVATTAQLEENDQDFSPEKDPSSTGGIDESEDDSDDSDISTSNDASISFSQNEDPKDSNQEEVEDISRTDEPKSQPQNNLGDSLDKPEAAEPNELSSSPAGEDPKDSSDDEDSDDDELSNTHAISQGDSDQKNGVMELHDSKELEPVVSRPDLISPEGQIDVRKIDNNFLLTVTILIVLVFFVCLFKCLVDFRNRSKSQFEHRELEEEEEEDEENNVKANNHHEPQEEEKYSPHLSPQQEKEQGKGQDDSVW